MYKKHFLNHLGGGDTPGWNTECDNRISMCYMCEASSLKRVGNKVQTYVAMDMSRVPKTKGKRGCT